MTTYLSTRQVCDTLGISRWTLARLIKANKITAIKGEGRNAHLRIDADSLAAYVEDSKVEATA
jgi:excisionase family DNA binding protein